MVRRGVISPGGAESVKAALAWCRKKLLAGARQSDEAKERHAAATMRTVAAALSESNPKLKPVLFSRSARDERIALVMRAVESEYRRARSIHGPHVSAHDGLGKIHEELLELQAEVFSRLQPQDRMRAEAIQVAAMAVAFLLEVVWSDRDFQIYRDDENGRRIQDVR